ncbi:MAG: hypothetical protein E7Z89_07115 [Cyanobacteria bacterium SIG28]|nr:hypothetical protein [Cyanobacteria bacterium SIG28]
MDDGYDFEFQKLAKNNNVKNIFKNIYKKINNRAVEQQQAGQLENYLLSAPIHYSKEELEEILRKFGLL